MHPRLHVPGPLAAGSSIELPPASAAHARALRLSPEQPLILFDGEGGEHISRITSAGRRRITVEVGPHDPVEREPPVAVHLYQAVGKGDRMDMAVEKATELGAARIVPVLSERTVVRLNDPERAERRRRHWQAVVISACEQCGRNTVPEVATPIPLADAWEPMESCASRLILEPGGEQRLGVVRPSSPTALLIGPEGGLSAAEVETALARGFTAIGAGPRILRTETAAIVALALLQSAAGEI